jgi:hypothetical protein
MAETSSERLIRELVPDPETPDYARADVSVPFYQASR